MAVTVHDPFGARSDEAIRFVDRALDPVSVQAQLSAMLRARGEDSIALRTIAVRRHKPGRRCLIAYEAACDDIVAPATILGKIRAKGADTRTYRLQRSLWSGPFGPESDDGVRVPEPIGVLPSLGMWCQREAPGSLDAASLAGPNGATLAARCADAIFKLHGVSVRLERRHSMDVELAILATRLRALSTLRPHWAPRLERLLEASVDLGASFEPLPPRVIHRDFYPDQVLIQGNDLYLLDLDLCARGDPGLDVGNFVAHMIELSLRTFGRAEGLACATDSFESRYLDLAGESARPSIRAHTTLTLARLVHISSSIAGREHLSEPLLELCEARLALHER